MTTLAALPTKDALILGCDSLGSVTREFVDPYEVLIKFFNHDGTLKNDKNGNQILTEFKDIYGLARNIPFNHMPHITKIFSLEPLEMGVMLTGITSIGERTISSLMGEFISDKKYFRQGIANYTVKKTAERLKGFICSHYDAKYTKSHYRPVLEFIVGGYDKQKQLPTVFRIKIGGSDQGEEKVKEEIKPGQFSPIFGGQMAEIERIVKGTDFNNKIKIVMRVRELIEKYKGMIGKFLAENNVSIDIPGFDAYSEDLFAFSEWDLDWFKASWGDFSEQNAIDCVNFFIEIMINSQQFSDTMPTVGGPVHIAVIKKGLGFRFVSREEYNHEGHLTPKNQRETNHV